MTDSITPFYRAAAPGDRDHDPPQSGKDRSRWPMAVVALLLFVTTTAAVLATTRTHAPTPQLWKQSTPGLFTRVPDGPEFRELLF